MQVMLKCKISVYTDPIPDGRGSVLVHRPDSHRLHHAAASHGIWHIPVDSRTGGCRWDARAAPSCHKAIQMDHAGSHCCHGALCNEASCGECRVICVCSWCKCRKGFSNLFVHVYLLPPGFITSLPVQLPVQQRLHARCHTQLNIMYSFSVL